MKLVLRIKNLLRPAIEWLYAWSEPEPLPYVHDPKVEELITRTSFEMLRSELLNKEVID